MQERKRKGGRVEMPDRGKCLVRTDDEELQSARRENLIEQLKGNQRDGESETSAALRKKLIKRLERSSDLTMEKTPLIERLPISVYTLLRLLWLLLKIAVVLSVMGLVGKIFELAGGYVVVLGVLLFLVYIYYESEKS